MIYSSQYPLSYTMYGGIIIICLGCECMLPYATCAHMYMYAAVVLRTYPVVDQSEDGISNDVSPTNRRPSRRLHIDSSPRYADRNNWYYRMHVHIHSCIVCASVYFVSSCYP